MHGFRILTIAPRVYERDGVLWARTSGLMQLLALERGKARALAPTNGS